MECTCLKRSHHVGGDGVYLVHEKNGMMLLYTYDGIVVTNKIYLEPEVQIALIKYFESMVQKE
jgi:hypothetical protein